MSFVANLNGDELGKVEGVTFKNRILQYYNSLGGSVNCAFGKVLLDEKSVSSDIGHPNYKSKTCSFAAIKDVLEKGSVTTPMKHHFVHGKKQPTGVISANITIGGIPFKMDVVVIQSLDGTLRIRCHDVYQLPPNENYQRGTVTNCILENNNIPSYDLFGNYIAKVQEKNKTNKENNIKFSKNMIKGKIKGKIRLTESQLHGLIKESIKNVLHEKEDWDKQEQYQIVMDAIMDLYDLEATSLSEADTCWEILDTMPEIEKSLQLIGQEIRNIRMHMRQTYSNLPRVSRTKRLHRV